MYKVQGEGGTSPQCNCPSLVYSSCGWSIHHCTSFVQPDSEQECLLGSNVLGITVTRASGKALTASGESRPAQVKLVQATAIPGRKGCYVKPHVDQERFTGGELLFEPKSKS